jgi:hypothetical protein
MTLLNAMIVQHGVRGAGHWWEDRQWEPKYWEKNLSQRHYFHHKAHTHCPVIEQWPLRQDTDS